MRMVRASVNLQLSQHLAPKSVFGKHPTNRVDDQIPRALLQKLIGSRRFEPPHVTAVAIVDLLVPLPAGESDLGGVDHYDVVSGIYMGRIDGLVLSPEASGNEACQTP